MATKAERFRYELERVRPEEAEEPAAASPRRTGGHARSPA